MPYPSLEQYNQAFQLHARLLADPELKSCAVAKSGLGLPLAISGGFALTYTLSNGSKKYAVRCFHREAKGLEKRYESISKKLALLKSSYFLDFSFQPHGIKVDGQGYPVVKMAWAKGETLGTFLETNHQNPQALLRLTNALSTLATYLESVGIAHGDVQPDNLMVSDGGLSLQLIDYDGMYVDDIRHLGSSELGQVNFQHVERKSVNPFDANLDRFSFISLIFAVKALRVDGALWKKTNSEITAIIFRSNDFLDPGSSKAFSLLSANSQLQEEARKFASICSSPYSNIPSLSDFLTGKYAASTDIKLSGTLQPGKAKLGYVGAYSVLSAVDFSACLQLVGDKVEVIGRITNVKQSVDKNGKPYIFVNFSDWRGHVFKVSIWHDGIAAIQDCPSTSWVGRWLSVVGLMEPRFSNGFGNSSNVSISISSAGQVTTLSESEASWRLGLAKEDASVTNTPVNGNLDTLSRIKGTTSASPVVRQPRTNTVVQNATLTPSQPAPLPVATKPTTANQELLGKIRGKSGSSPTSVGGTGATIPRSQPSPTWQAPPRYTKMSQQPSQRPPQKSLLSKLFGWIVD